MAYLRSTYQTGTTLTVSQSTVGMVHTTASLIDELEKALNL